MKYIYVKVVYSVQVIQIDMDQMLGDGEQARVPAGVDRAGCDGDAVGHARV